MILPSDLFMLGVAAHVAKHGTVTIDDAESILEAVTKQTEKQITRFGELTNRCKEIVIELETCDNLLERYLLYQEIDAIEAEINLAKNASLV